MEKIELACRYVPFPKIEIQQGIDKKSMLNYNPHILIYIQYLKGKGKR